MTFEVVNTKADYWCRAYPSRNWDWSIARPPEEAHPADVCHEVETHPFVQICWYTGHPSRLILRGFIAGPFRDGFVAIRSDSAHGTREKAREYLEGVLEKG